MQTKQAQNEVAINHPPNRLNRRLKCFNNAVKLRSTVGLCFCWPGVSGAGKSSTVNSLLDKKIAPVGHFEATTFEVKSYNFTMKGIVDAKSPSLPQTMQRCQLVADRHSPDSRSFHERLDASDKTVNELWFRVDFTSAFCPRKPVNVTRFEYMMFSFCPRCLSGHPEASGAAPKSEASSRSALLGGPAGRW